MHCGCGDLLELIHNCKDLKSYGNKDLMKLVSVFAASCQFKVTPCLVQ